jgi:hypothetical protein
MHSQRRGEMQSTDRRGGTVLRTSLRWFLALALAMTLHPAVASTGGSTASLQPEQLRIVQRALRDHGLQLEVTGAWDDDTRAALTQFQATSGLAVTGELDGGTSRALGVDPQKVMPVGAKTAVRDEYFDLLRARAP